MAEKKTDGQKLADKLLNQKQSSYRTFAKQKGYNVKKADAFCDEYIAFLNAAKTEREVVGYSEAALKKLGFKPLKPGKALKPGDKVYMNNRKKSLVAAVVGADSLDMGTRIIAAHVDSPRLDLKPNPLYEDADMAFFKSHYYGGIKKYQWVTIPLSMHGVVVKKSGETVEIAIGEQPGDPVFCVTDLLPHLSRKVQDKRTANDAVKGEELNILIGSEPIADDDSVKEPVKLAIMKALNDKYGIVEADLISAEIQFVPAFNASYVGFDKSLIGGYAQDDRVCAFAALKGFAEAAAPQSTAILILADKEEVGSDGNTGLNSDLLRNFISLLCKATGATLEIALANSKCLSSDVSAAFDPTFPEVNDRRNAAYINRGPSVEKYTGSGGKYNTSEASAEYMAEVRALFDENDLPWQSGELGRIDEGGGGTVAKYIANLGVDVVDVGVPVLSMHSPFEITGKIDLYAMYLAFIAFYK